VTGTELAFLSAAELGRRIARREVSPVEVVEEQLRRIERLDPGLSCYITVLADRALDQARRAEAEIVSTGSRGQLHGVPVALKDIFDTTGVRTTSGSKILANHVPDRDAHVVERLAAAGTILLGKLNMHEFAYGLTTTNPHWGPCRNPWNRDRVPGGSSGGSGAALAAGLCTMSLGTDTGGSIRIPASACGVVGLKPTFGRVSRRGVCPLAWSLDHVGPMARTVEDAALMLGAIAAPDSEDAWCSSAPVPDFLSALELGLGGITIGVPRRWFFDDLEPEVGHAVETALGVLISGGARRIDVDLAHLEHAHTAVHAIVASEASAFHRSWLKTRPEDYGEEMRRSLELGSLLPAIDYIGARRIQTLVRNGFLAAFERCDVLVMPTLPRTALRIGEPISREPGVAWNRLLTPLNLAGLPAISVPCGFDRDSMPIGLQIAGRPFDETTVLRVAHTYERATDWHERRPPGVD